HRQESSTRRKVPRLNSRRSALLSGTKDLQAISQDPADRTTHPEAHRSSDAGIFRYSGFHVIDQCIRQPQPARKHVEIAAFGAGSGLDGEARSGIELDFLSIRLGSSNERIEVNRPLQLRHHESGLILANTAVPETLGDLAAFGFVYVPVRPRGGNHGAQKRESEFILALRRLSGVEGRIGWRRKELAAARRG